MCSTLRYNYFAKNKADGYNAGNFMPYDQDGQQIAVKKEIMRNSIFK